MSRAGSRTGGFRILSAGSILPEEDEELSFSAPLKGQEEVVQEAIRRITKSHAEHFPELPSILAAHLFTLVAQNRIGR